MIAVFDSQRRELRIPAQQGFERAAVAFWVVPRCRLAERRVADDGVGLMVHVVFHESHVVFVEIDAAGELDLHLRPRAQPNGGRVAEETSPDEHGACQR